MKHVVSLFGVVCALVVGSATAATVTTKLFTMEVPDGWTIENNGSDTIAVAGPRMVDRMPMPALIIQYCTNAAIDNISDSSALAPCTDPCSKESLSASAADNGTLSAVQRQVTRQGIVELREEVVSRPRGADVAGLSCSPLGQVHVGLVSDESKDQAGKLFEGVFSSIAWKQDVAPAAELMTERRRLTVRDRLPFARTQWGDGVIFPPAFGDHLVGGCSRESLGPGDAYWQPTERDVQQAERIVAEYMSQHKLDSSEVHTWPDQPGPEKWPDLKGYQRQYMGVIRGTHRTIYASFVPAKEALADEHWRRRPFSMCDGGSSLFGIETDLTSSTVLHIAFDGCMCHIVPSQ